MEKDDSVSWTGLSLGGWRLPSRVFAAYDQAKWLAGQIVLGLALLGCFCILVTTIMWWGGPF